MIFLILGERGTFGINGSFDAPEKKLVLFLVNQKQNFAWLRITMVIIIISLLMGKKVYKFKVNNENVNFLSQFLPILMSG